MQESRFKLAKVFAVGVFGGLIANAIGRGIPQASAQGSPFGLSNVQWTAGSRVYARMAATTGQGSELTFFDAAGHARLKMGLAPDGLPFFSFFTGTDSTTPKASLHLEGPYESAVLILRDKLNKERLSLGINPRDDNQEPFFAYFDKAGVKRRLFGKY